MPVTVKEYVKIKTIDGFEQEGQAIAGNLVAIQDEGGSFFFGEVLEGVKMDTTVVCDNPLCTQGLVDIQMKTIPKTIEFDQNGNGPNGAVADASKIVTLSDFNNTRLVFCCAECASNFLRRVVK